MLRINLKIICNFAFTLQLWTTLSSIIKDPNEVAIKAFDDNVAKY